MTTKTQIGSDEVRKACALIKEGLEALENALVTAFEAPTPKPRKSSRAKKEKPETEPVADPQPEPTSDPAPETETTLPTVEEVRAALIEVKDQLGAESARAILVDLGVNTLPELDKKSYPKVLEKARALL